MFYLNNWLVHEVKFAAGQCHKRQMTRSWRSKHHNINFLFYYTWDGTEMRCRSCQSLRIPYEDSFSFFYGSVRFQNPILHPVSPPYMYALFSICYRFQFSSTELIGCTCVHLYPLLGLPLYPWQDDDEDSVLQGVSPIVWRVGTF